MKRLSVILATLLVALSAAAQAPLVGVVCGHKSNNYASDDYLNAVRMAGGLPVLVPATTCQEEAEAVLGYLDGILFIGGEDVHPAWYGEEIDGAVGINEFRDSSEIHMIRYAASIGLPMLGICRGCQVINVALGGSLVQDIPSQVETDLVHKQSDPGTVGTQTMQLDPGSHLAEVLGVTEASINSFHHEAVKVPAKGLKVVGRTPDGVVEAYEGLPEVNVVAVQFHPEKAIDGGDYFFLPLFKDFVERAKAYSK